MKRSHAWLSLVVVMAVVWLVEVALLEAKYGTFSGGFLQPHALLSLTEVLSFVLLSLYFDVVLLLVAGFIWFRTARAIGCHSPVASYLFLFAAGGTALAYAAARYKLWSYFSDTVDYAILRNLSGGGLDEGVRFATQELTISAFFVGGAVLVFLFGLRPVSRFDRSMTAAERRCSSGPDRLRWRQLAVLLVATMAITYGANSVEPLQRSLEKKLSYQLANAVWIGVTDVDGDGYSSLSFPRDHAPFDDRRFPGALDVPDNGIDEDGIAGDFRLHSRETFEYIAWSRPGSGMPHIVLVILESARADTIGKEINGKIVAPVINELASQGKMVENAYAHASWTGSALRAIFMGNEIGRDIDGSLFERLHGLGYLIGVFSGQDEGFSEIADTTRMREFSRRFFDARIGINDRVVVSTDAGSLRLDEKRVLAEIGRYLKDTDLDQPQFLYVNFQAAHFPYSHPGFPKLVTDSLIPRAMISEPNREWVEQTYWNAVAYQDWAVGELIDALKDARIYDNTVLFVTSDHGESLYENGFLGHGHALNDAQTRIPFVTNEPDLDVREPLSQSQIYHVVLSVATGRAPVFQPRAGRPVFQYTGDLKHPQQIGSVDLHGTRTIVDLRERSARLGDTGTWVPLGHLSPGEETVVADLIDYWDWLRWAQFGKNRE